MSVACKVGCIPKEEIGVKDSEKVFIGEYESMCNPILQAAIVNEAKTDFNILLGLCVGHDSLFFKYAKAPTTVLAVKDRVTGTTLWARSTYWTTTIRGSINLSLPLSYISHLPRRREGMNF